MNQLTSILLIHQFDFILFNSVVISGCVVASGAIIETGTKMYSCQVGPNFKVEYNDYKDEQLTGCDMELYNESEEDDQE